MRGMARMSSTLTYPSDDMASPVCVSMCVCVYLCVNVKHGSKKEFISKEVNFYLPSLPRGGGRMRETLTLVPDHRPLSLPLPHLLLLLSRLSLSLLLLLSFVLLCDCVLRKLPLESGGKAQSTRDLHFTAASPMCV